MLNRAPRAIRYSASSLWPLTAADRYTGTQPIAHAGSPHAWDNEHDNIGNRTKSWQDDAVEATGDKLGCFSEADAKLLSLATLAEGWRHLQAAETAAGVDAALRHRVRVAQMPIQYAFLVKWERLRAEAKESGSPWPIPERVRGVYDRFLKTAKAANVTKVSEQHKLDEPGTIVDRLTTREGG